MSTLARGAFFFGMGATVATALKWAAGQCIPTVERMQRLADRPRGVSFQILQNGANDQSSACETIFEVPPTSVLVLLGSCQSRLQREWA